MKIDDELLNWAFRYIPKVKNPDFSDGVYYSMILKEFHPSFPQLEPQTITDYKIRNLQLLEMAMNKYDINIQFNIKNISQGDIKQGHLLLYEIRRCLNQHKTSSRQSRPPQSQLLIQQAHENVDSNQDEPQENIEQQQSMIKKDEDIPQQMITQKDQQQLQVFISQYMKTSSGSLRKTIRDIIIEEKDFSLAQIQIKIIDAISQPGDLDLLRVRDQLQDQTIPPKPKKPINSVFRYFQSVRDEVSQKNPTKNAPEINALMSEMWLKLSDDAKKPFQDEYDREYAQYQEELKQWNEKYKQKLKEQQLQNEKPSKIKNRRVSKKMKELVPLVREKQQSEPEERETL